MWVNEKPREGGYMHQINEFQLIRTVYGNNFNANDLRSFAMLLKQNRKKGLKNSGFLVSKEAVVLRRWERFDFIRRVDKG